VLRPLTSISGENAICYGDYVTTARALCYERNCHHLVIGPTIALLVHFAIGALPVDSMGATLITDMSLFYESDRALAYVYFADEPGRRSAAWMCLSLHPAVMRPRSWIIIRRRCRGVNAASLAASGDISTPMSGYWLALVCRQCWCCEAHGCNCSAKNQPCDFCHVRPLRVGKQDDFFVIYAVQKIGLHCRKFHHAFLSNNAEPADTAGHVSQRLVRLYERIG
jgi:hypothetical protein